MTPDLLLVRVAPLQPLVQVHMPRTHRILKLEDHDGSGFGKHTSTTATYPSGLGPNMHTLQLKISHIRQGSSGAGR